MTNTIGITAERKPLTYFPKRMEQDMPKQSNHDNKKRSAANSTKHGVFAQRIMSCRKMHCYYAELCSLCNSKDIEAISYGDDCPIEADLFREWKQDFVTAAGVPPGTSESILDNIIILMLQIRRTQMMNAIHPDFVRQIPSKFPGYTKPAFTLGVRYRRELSALLSKELMQLTATKTTG